MLSKFLQIIINFSQTYSRPRVCSFSIAILSFKSLPCGSIFIRWSLFIIWLIKANTCQNWTTSSKVCQSVCKLFCWPWASNQHLMCNASWNRRTQNESLPVTLIISSLKRGSSLIMILWVRQSQIPDSRMYYAYSSQLDSEDWFLQNCDHYSWIVIDFSHICCPQFSL